MREALRQCPGGDGEVQLLPPQQSQKQMLVSASGLQHFWGKISFTPKTKMPIASALEPQDEMYVIDNIGTVSRLDLLTCLFLFCH